MDTTNCLTPCSGLIVTSFTQSEMAFTKEKILEMTEVEDLFLAYDEYKKITQYPSGYTGNDLDIFSLWV